MKQCMFPECPDDIKARGLCGKHYVAALYRIHRGQVTWDELEDHKKCLPTKSAKRGKLNNWFTDFKNVK